MIQCIWTEQKELAFITLKDHKDSFKSNPKIRLVNPTKSELGINAAIRTKTKPNQWANTDDVIDWLGKLPNVLSFLVFDIVDFYPSITGY